jgi:hypothetical protein
LIRTAIAAIVVILAAGVTGGEVRADPYRWCADYGGWRGGGARNCYFMTLGQCRATISGVGGTCVPNPFFDGRPVRTPEDGAPVRRKRRTY